MKKILSALSMLVIGCSALAQSELITTKTESGKTVEFILHLPGSYDAGKDYPVVVGPSELESLEGSYYWKDFKSNESWILIDAPIYLGVGQIEALIAIRKYLKDNYSLEGGKFHAVCFSANSSPVFKLVMAAPELFHSVTGMPASVSASDTNFKRLEEVKVQLLVGADDGYWVRSSKSLQSKLKSLGIDSRLEIFPGIGHFLLNIRGQPLLDRLDKLRP
ncbi:hypothetical protein SAMN04488029_3628 [Reichenbachiella faecimaris]|uniref:Alpha/beta hydrolase family protein n=1 Tax=Reichenbachiella faecimaris TaxID=692418 RepID=A0A1W2GN48_REIFA|nr:hypothetical protein [Reichenbachiella faecimaris]SMD38093.1 hypothetical protein SAMN04488029_3628 [Reichenbachiella faecimaris]